MENTDQFAPSIDQIILTAFMGLPLAWDVAGHQLFVILPQDLLIFLLRCLPTAPEYAERLFETRRHARRQLRRWGYKPEQDNDTIFMHDKIHITKDVIAADMRSAIEILTHKLKFRPRDQCILATNAFHEFTAYVKRYPT